MPWWKELLLLGYIPATSPWRRQWLRDQIARGQAPVLVLFYHRVADTALNPWTCRTRVFQRQIAWLKEHFEPVSLVEGQKRIASGQNTVPSVCITFDDGYADNHDFALPLLIQEEVPCTYFVSSRFVLRQEPFPHDVARGTPLAPNTIDQLRHWVDQGIQIGAHTRTHADLGSIRDEKTLQEEMLGSRDDLERALLAPIHYFAFPYGQKQNLTQAGYSLAHKAGFKGICSAYGGLNLPGDDPFHLQREHADDSLGSLINRASFDPRRKKLTRFSFEQGGDVPGDFSGPLRTQLDQIPAQADGTETSVTIEVSA